MKAEATPTGAPRPTLRVERAPTSPQTEDGSWEDYLNPGGGDLFAKAHALQAQLTRERAQGNFFFRRPLLSASRGHARVRNLETGQEQDVIMMGSNSYLGMNSDPRVIAASIRAAEKYGYGTGSVSLYAGTTDLHLELERRIAAFYACEDAILFPTGYAANVGTISGLVRENDVVVGDLFNHASIYEGCALSGARQHSFAHRNVRRLERVLREVTGPNHGTLVITDGVFSMEGALAPLDDIIAVARRYGARVMIDEAHAIGVVGPGGRGTAEHFGLQGEVDITVGTLSKAPGSLGGYAAGSREVIDYLRYYARPYFFSTSLPTPVVAGLIEVFHILETDTFLREKLWRNIRDVKAGLASLGFDLGASESAIIPVIVRDESRCKALLRDLNRAGVFVNFVGYPAVPKRRCRLRFGIMSQHTREDIDYVLETMGRLGRAHGIIA